MRRRGEDTLERYGASMFYGAGPELAPTRSSNTFGATYSNGQARPVTGFQAPAATRSPEGRIAAPVAQLQPGGGARNENWNGADAISLSRETLEERNGSAQSSRLAFSTVSRTGRGNAQGPVYSSDFRHTLDALLDGFCAGQNSL